MKFPEIHQILPALEEGDAIGNYTRALRNFLRKKGITSEIFVFDRKPGQKQCRRWTEHGRFSSPDNILIFHTAIGSPLARYFQDCPDRKVLVHHNITPARFFAELEPEDAWLSILARRQLYTLAKTVDAAAADSNYNALELVEAGYPEPTVIPLPFNWDKLDKPPDADILAALKNGDTNILFVGRITPNKRQQDLIRIFSFYLEGFNPNARMYLVGEREHFPAYSYSLEQLSRELGIEDRVVLTGKVTDDELRAYYSGSHLFLCMSEHEGFGVPLVEALYFGLPIVARAAGAVPDTLGKAGILVKNANPAGNATLINRVIADPVLKNTLLETQQTRLNWFREFPFEQTWDNIFQKLISPSSTTTN